MNKDQGSAEDQQWIPCSRGVLKKAATTQVDRRRKFLKLIAGSTVLAAVGGGTALGVRLSKTPQRAKKSRNSLPVLGGIACITVVELMPNFVDGKLEKQVAEQVTSHLMDCPKCRGMYTQLCRNSDQTGVSRPRNPKFKTTPCESR